MIEEEVDVYFTNPQTDYFMITSCNFKENKKDAVPAVVHVDGTGRLHIVRQKDNRHFHELIRNFGELTGEYIILNTSMNIKGEPIVCSPVDAVKCFYSTGIDAMFIGSYLLLK